MRDARSTLRPGRSSLRMGQEINKRARISEREMIMKEGPVPAVSKLGEVRPALMLRRYQEASVLMVGRYQH